MWLHPTRILLPLTLAKDAEASSDTNEFQLVSHLTVTQNWKY